MDTTAENISDDVDNQYMKHMSRYIYKMGFSNASTVPNMCVPDDVVEFANGVISKLGDGQVVGANTSTVHRLDMAISLLEEFSPCCAREDVGTVTYMLRYIKASKKQLQRRGKIGQFKGHTKHVRSDMDIMDDMSGDIGAVDVHDANSDHTGRGEESVASLSSGAYTKTVLRHSIPAKNSKKKKKKKKGTMEENARTPPPPPPAHVEDAEDVEVGMADKHTNRESGVVDLESVSDTAEESSSYWQKCVVM